MDAWLHNYITHLRPLYIDNLQVKEMLCDHNSLISISI